MSRDIDGTSTDVWDEKFREDLAADTAFEASLLFKEIGMVTIIMALALLLSLSR
jgi:hypothetical protein